MTRRTLDRPSRVLRGAAAVVLAAEACAIVGLYVISMLFAGGIGPEDPGTPTPSTFGVRVFSSAVFLPPIVLWALAAAAMFWNPTRGWKRAATLIASTAVTLGNAILAVLSIVTGHLMWTLVLGAATAVLTAATWQLFSSPRRRRAPGSLWGAAARS